jgi:hypothetical protein
LLELRLSASVYKQLYLNCEGLGYWSAWADVSQLIDTVIGRSLTLLTFRKSQSSILHQCVYLTFHCIIFIMFGLSVMAVSYYVCFFAYKYNVTSVTLYILSVITSLPKYSLLCTFRLWAMCSVYFCCWVLCLSGQVFTKATGNYNFNSSSTPQKVNKTRAVIWRCAHIRDATATATQLDGKLKLNWEATRHVSFLWVKFPSSCTTDYGKEISSRK